MAEAEHFSIVRRLAAELSPCISLEAWGTIVATALSALGVEHRAMLQKLVGITRTAACMKVKWLVHA